MRLFSTGGGGDVCAAAILDEAGAKFDPDSRSDRTGCTATIFSILFGFKTLRPAALLVSSSMRSLARFTTIQSRRLSLSLLFPFSLLSSFPPSLFLSLRFFLRLALPLPPFLPRPAAATLRNDSVIYAPLVCLPLCFKFMYFGGEKDFHVPRATVLSRREVSREVLESAARGGLARRIFSCIRIILNSRRRNPDFASALLGSALMNNRSMGFLRR